MHAQKDNVILSKEQVKKYGSEIEDLCKSELGEEAPLNGLTYFGIFSGDELQAVAGVKCYMGYWYLRACVVKREYRGRGFQQQLIQERLDYLSRRTKEVRVSVFPGNEHSIRNVEAMGFQFDKQKRLKDGKVIHVFKKKL